MMKLSFEQIKSVTVGAVQISQESDGFHFCKMTPGQVEAYRAISEAQYNNSRATTGVRLDFHTNSPYVKYVTTTTAKYELAVDGCQTPVILAQKGEAITYPLPEGEHRVTIYLPAHGPAGGLAEVELADGATLTRHKFDRKFLFIGDSIIQGWKSELDTQAYTYRVSDHFNAESIIQGTGSACFAQSTLEKLDFDPDTVFVAYGTNDMGGVKTTDEMHDRAKGYLAKLQSFYPNARFVVISPPWIVNYDQPRTAGSVADICKAIRVAACELGMDTVVGENMIPHMPSLFIDNCHPNSLGFAYYAHNLIKAIL